MGTLIGYELKKIIKRKMLWICMAVSFAGILVAVGGSLLGSYYVEGERKESHYEMFQADAAYQKALSGRLMDAELMGEMQEGYRKVPVEREKYSETKEYQKYARPYSAVFHYVRQTTGMNGEELLSWEPEEGEFQKMRLARMEKKWDAYQLSEKEKAFWRAEETKIEQPVTFQYAEGYAVLSDSAYTVGILSLFMSAVCLAGMFRDEYVKRTEQLIFCSRYGKEKIFHAKFIAGILAVLFMALSFVLTAFLAAFFLYGAEGFTAAYQLLYPDCSSPISAGGAVLLLYLMILMGSVFLGVFVMLLSEKLHSSVGTLAIAVGSILLPMMFSMPEQYRIPAQVWSYLPSEIITKWNLFGPYTVMIAGKAYLPWQAVPVVYLVLGSGIWFAAKRLFIKHQTGG